MLLLVAIAIASGVLVARLSRPAPQQYVVMPIESVQQPGIGCLPVLLVLLALAVLWVLMPAS